MRFLLQKILAFSLLAGVSQLHANVLSPESAKRAVQAYCQTIAQAHALEEMEKHWSSNLKRAQAKIKAEQLMPLNAEMRSTYQRAVLGMLKDMAMKMPEEMNITCTATSCKVAAELSSQWKQTFVLVKENGAIVIDDAHSYFGSDVKAR